MDIRQISTRLSVSDSLEIKLENILALLTSYVDAERGCMMVTREGKELILFSGDEDLNLRFPFSRSVVSEAMVGSTGLVSFQAEKAEGDTLSSMAMHGVRAALCVPILGPEEEDFGILYFDSRIDQKLFSQNQLHEVMGIAKEIGVILK